MTSTEFWSMYPTEVWWWLEAKKPELFATKVSDLEELYQMLHEDDDV